MGKSLYSFDNYANCCSSKLIQGVSLNSVTTIQPTEIEQVFTTINNGGTNIINIGDYAEELSNIILNITSNLLVDVNISNTINIGNGQLYINGSSITSNSNINITPTDLLNINGNFQTIGQTANFTTDFFTTKARVPIIGYDTNPIGTGIINDNLDRGIAFDWPETFNTSPFTRKNTGFFGWNNTNNRFVFWNKVINITPNNYQRATSNIFEVEIDALYTNIIKSDNITGSSNTDLLIQAGSNGTSNLSFIAGNEIHLLSNFEKIVTSDSNYSTYGTTNYIFGSQLISGSGNFIILDNNNNSNKIQINPFNILLSHINNINLTTLNTGNINITSNNNINEISNNNYLLTTTNGQYFANIKTNIINSSNNGYITFLSSQNLFIPPNTLNPTPSIGDYDIKAYNKITAQSNKLISFNSVDSNIVLTTSTGNIFNESNSGIYSIAKSTHTITTIPQGSILINAGLNNPVINTQNTLILNSGNDTLLNNNNLTSISTNTIRIENNSINKTVNIRSLLGSLYLSTDNNLPTLLNGSILIKTANTLNPIITNDSINIIANDLINISSESSSININSNSGTNITNDNSGNITIRNLINNINLLTDSGGILLASQNITPTLSSGALLFLTNNTTYIDYGINSIGFISNGLYSITSNNSINIINQTTGSILLENKIGKITIVSNVNSIYLGTNITQPIQSNGSILIGTSNNSLINPGTNSIGILSANSVLLESETQGITIQTTDSSNNLLPLSVKSIVLNSNVNPSSFNIVNNNPVLGGIIQLNPSLYVLINGKLRIDTLEGCTGSSTINIISKTQINNTLIIKDNFIFSNPSTIGELLKITDSGNLEYLIVKKISSSNVLLNIGNTTTNINFNIYGNTLLYNGITPTIELSPSGILNFFSSNSLTSNGLNIAYFNGNVNISGTSTANEILIKTYNNGSSITPPNITTSGSGAFWIKHESYSLDNGIANYTRPIYGDYNSTSSKSHYIMLMSINNGIPPSTTTPGQIPYYNHSLSQDFILSNPPTSSGQILSNNSGTLIWSDNNLQTIYDNSQSILYSINLSHTLGNPNGIIIKNNSGVTINNDIFAITNSLNNIKYFSITGQGDTININAGTSTSSINNTSIININSGTNTNNGGTININAGNNFTKQGIINIISNNNLNVTPTNTLLSGDIGLTSANNIKLLSYNSINLTSTNNSINLTSTTNNINLTSEGTSSIIGNINLISGVSNSKLGIVNIISNNNLNVTPTNTLLSGDIGLTSANNIKLLSYNSINLSSTNNSINLASTTNNINLTSEGTSLIIGNINLISGVSNSKLGIVNIISNNNLNVTPTNTLISGDIGLTSANNIKLLSYNSINLTSKGATPNTTITIDSGVNNTNSGIVSIISNKISTSTPSNTLVAGDVGITATNKFNVVTSDITSITTKLKTYILDTVTVNSSNVGSLSIAGKRIIRERLPTITALAPTATTTNIISAINEIIDRLILHGLIEAT